MNILPNLLINKLTEKQLGHLLILEVPNDIRVGLHSFSNAIDDYSYPSLLIKGVEIFQTSIRNSENPQEALEELEDFHSILSGYFMECRRILNDRYVQYLPAFYLSTVVESVLMSFHK